MLWGFISTEAWMHGDTFISVQWGFHILTSLLMHTAICIWNNSIWILFHTKPATLLVRQICTHLSSLLVIRFIKIVPSRFKQACLLYTQSVRNARLGEPGKKGAALHNGLLVFDADQIKWTEGENEAFAIQQENKLLRHWFTLGSEPQYLIIAMGVWSRPWYFRAVQRQHSAVTMLALHESYSLCGLAAIKTERMPFLSQKP